MCIYYPEVKGEHACNRVVEFHKTCTTELSADCECMP